MNRTAVTREELLAAARDIVGDEGLGALNIRRVAAACGISVGCIYNYFPSKAELVAALMESFWSGTFHRGLGGCVPRDGAPFPDFVEEAYARLGEVLEGFSARFLSQMSLLSREDRAQGRAREAECWRHMRAGLLRVLMEDKTIPPEVWGEGFTPQGVADFAFYAMMDGLRRGEPGCGPLAEFLRRSLRPGQARPCAPDQNQKETNDDIHIGNGV